MGHDPGDRRVIHQPSVTSPIQIDKVQTGGPLIDPPLCHRHGVVTKDRFSIVVSLLEAHAFASTQINRWPNLHFRMPNNGKIKKSRI
jgi:hypothetical protein